MSALAIFFFSAPKICLYKGENLYIMRAPVNGNRFQAFRPVSL